MAGGAGIFRRTPEYLKLAVANATIEGQVGLLTGGSGIMPCAGARIYLLLRPVDVDSVKRKVIEKNGTFSPHLAHMYLDMVISSPETQHKLSYARTRADDNGNFLFPNLPPDRWYYVTAQALTDHVMVSWQVGVYLLQGERVQIVLTNTNAALPIYRPPDVLLANQDKA